MRNKIKTITTIWIIIFSPYIYSADSNDLSRRMLNAEMHGTPIQNLVNGRIFENKLGNETATGCNNLLRAINDGKNIKHISPIVSDPSLSKDIKPNSFFEKCPDYNTLIWYPQIIRNEIYEAIKENGFLSEEKKEIFDQHKIIYKSTSHEHLYRVDINNNSSDGLEYVFHGSGFFSEEYVKNNKSNSGSGYLKSFSSDAGRFYVINGNDCSKSYVLTVHDPYNYSVERKLNNRNGIVNYKNKNYIYDLYESSPVVNEQDYRKRYNLKIYIADNKKKTFVEMCNFYEKQ